MAARIAVYHAGEGYRNAFYQRNALTALAIAVVLHCLAVVSYYIATGASHDEFAAATKIRTLRIVDLPQTSIQLSGATPQVEALTSSPKIVAGSPVPVPDAEVRAEQTIPSVLDQPVTGASSSAVDGGNIVVVEPAAPPEEPLRPFASVEKPPRVVTQVSPEYPEIARRAGVEGTVWVKIVIDKEGKVRKAEIERSDADVFNEPALNAARQWVFTPALMNSGPVEVWGSIPFNFKLRK
jgi:protein TonB